MKWADYYEYYDNWQESTQYSRLASVTDWGAESSTSHQIADCIQYVNERTAVSILKKALQANIKFSPAEIVEIVDTGITDDSAIIKRLLQSSSGDFSGEQFVTLLNCLVDEEPVLALLEKVGAKNNNFQEKEILELAEILCDNELIEQLLRKSNAVFSENGLNKLCDYGIDEGVLELVSKRSGIPYQNPEAEYDFDIDDENELAAQNVAPKKKGCFWSVLAGILSTKAVVNLLQEETKPTKVTFNESTGTSSHCPPHYGYRYGRWYYGHGHDWGCELCEKYGCCNDSKNE